MSEEQDEQLRNAIASVPALAGFSGVPERLGGLTNLVYRLGDVCLRLPGKGTSEYINRTHEAETAKAAAIAGVSPELIHADPVTGIMATRFLAGTRTMSQSGFREVPGSVVRAGRVFNKLHTSGVKFPFTFELFAMIDDYLAILATRDVALPVGYHDVVAEAKKVRAVLQAKPVPLVACHCDPLCENLLDDGTRMYLIDWEYSGMNDPMWDLGDLSVEAGFDAKQDEALLVAYFSGTPQPADKGRMIIFKAMCDLLWTLWGLIQLANGNPAEDFRAYADGRFARCRTLMASAQFQESVAAVANQSTR